jgi:quinol monooxygenase YgiN
MPFIQLIEFKTNRIDEFNATIDEWLKESAGWRTAIRAQMGEDRDRPGTYVQVVEFPSYEAAMENSNRPETGKFAERLAALCDGPATFRNLDIVRSEEM